MLSSPKKKSPQGKNGDNMDTVDMEMSDEEQDGGFDGGRFLSGPICEEWEFAYILSSFLDSSMDNNGGNAPPFMNFPPPGQMPQQQQQQQGQWGHNGMHDSPANGNGGCNNQSPWSNKPQRGGGGGGAFFRPQGEWNPGFRGRGGFNRGGGDGPPNGMFRGRGSPFRGGNFRGNRGGARGMW